MLPIDAITVATCGVRPVSRGATHIASDDCNANPDIVVNFLDSKDDQQVAVEAFKKARAILQQPALRAYVTHEVAPGNAVQTDAEILEYIRNTGEPVHHLAGSCKMGHDAMAVVDDQLRVHGMAGLRVADASIMPEVVSGNTHAACVMIGEKCAAMILEQ
jgi:choline dehydrogenase